MFARDSVECMHSGQDCDGRGVVLFSGRHIRRNMVCVVLGGVNLDVWLRCCLPCFFSVQLLFSP